MAPLMIPERKKEMIKAEQQDFSARSLNSWDNSVFSYSQDTK